MLSPCGQWRQSDMKSWEVADPGQNKFRFFQANCRKFRFFQTISQKVSIFQAKIGHLQLLLGKLFYFSSKVTTFEHTNDISRPPRFPGDPLPKIWGIATPKPPWQD